MYYDICSLLLLQEVYGYVMRVMACLDRRCLDLTYFLAYENYLCELNKIELRAPN
jgi:hypothetical protein